jgi:hypothetical protein
LELRRGIRSKLPLEIRGVKLSVANLCENFVLIAGETRLVKIAL